MYLNRFDQRSLSWAMMNVAAAHLAPVERTWLWVKIGAGDLESALVTLVGICMRNDVALPADVEAALRDWLSGYYGTEVAAAFEPYVGVVARTSAVNDVSSAQDGFHIGCDRFANRARRDPVGSARFEGFRRASSNSE